MLEFYPRKCSYRLDNTDRPGKPELPVPSTANPRNAGNRMAGIAMIILELFLLPLPAYAEKPYFQQRVIYDIRADIDPESAKIAAIENITYFNNSPDTLKEVYFHLYYNAFQPGSYLDRQEKRSGNYFIASMSPKNRGEVIIDKIKIDGQEITNHLIDNTIMTVPLISPLSPGDSTLFYIEYTSQIPARGSRTAHAGKHFDIGQWYPKPVVYDRYGWHAHQYLDYEFYSDFADFRVELTMPSEYIIAHVGELLNEKDIFGASLPIPMGDTILIDALKHLDIDSTGTTGAHAAIEEIGVEKDSGEIIPPDTAAGKGSDTLDVTQTGEKRKTWVIRAENIHDFSFCADPKFIIDICRYNEVTIKTYYDKSTKERWERKAADFTRKSLRLFSGTFFPYPYGQYSIVASLVGGGMEYPQLTMISRYSGERDDYSHDLESIIAHEVAHAWFYGILGFNETEQSYLDEGLATFSTTLYLEHYYGRYKNNYVYKKDWQKKLLPNGNDRNDSQRRYIERARIRDEDPMITPANLFLDGGRYYNASYEKASTVYLMLQYTLGDEKFDRFMRLLFARWAFKHPHLSDLQELAEEISGEDLDWFFRQWFTTTWSLDYSLDRFKRKRVVVDGISGYNASISIGKQERCISPLDVALYSKDGSIQMIRIPLEAWKDGQLSFDTTVFLSAKPKKAVVNPDERLADINRLDNSSGIARVKWQLLTPRIIFEDSYVEHFVDSYTIAHQPSLWYNSVDGVTTGYRFFGSFLGEARKIDLQANIGMQNAHMDHYVGWENVVYDIHPDLSYFINTKEADGRGRQAAGISYSSGGHWDAAYLRWSLSLERRYMFDRNYLYGSYWSAGNVNTIELSASAGFRHRLSRTAYDVKLSSSIPGDDYNFTRAECGFMLTILGFAGNNTRIQLKAGVSNGNTPLQQRFYLSSADPYEIWNSPFFASRGTLPDKWKREGHLFKPGGAGLEGYLNRGLTGTRILSIRLSRELPSIRFPLKIPIVPGQLRKVSWELYFASGLVWERKEDSGFDNFLSEAGFVFGYDVPYLDRLVGESRLVLFLPLWLSDPSGNEREFEWRWLFSVIP